ncbi:MAG TPA: nuclear transport factor 2 family protein [Pyrinomonadaceae bacterium]|nr:nuclear transport factor 2 family protein [Pyrinomonadaceae bacterium]
MSRSVVSVALVLTILVLAGCQPARDTNLNATATASPAKETFDPAAIQAEVLNVERDWVRAGETYDVEAIRRIVADDAVLVYPDGTPGTKADEVRIAETKAITGRWEMIDPKVTVLSADSAFITGRSSIKDGKYKEPTMAKAIDISGEYRFLDVYARRNGRWQVVASQATKVAIQTPAASPTASAAAAPPSPPRPSPTATKTP